MPLRVEIEELDRTASRPAAAAEFGLDCRSSHPAGDRADRSARGASTRPSSIGSHRLIAAGYQVLHIQGGRGELTDPGHRALPPARLLRPHGPRSRASPISRSRVPVQRRCANSPRSASPPSTCRSRWATASSASTPPAWSEPDGGILVDDARFLPEWVDERLVPLLRDRDRVAAMGERAASVGVRDGSDRMVSLIHTSLARA